MSTTFKHRLKNAGIRHFDKLIHDQPKDWLIKYFSHGADKYPINVACLMRNIIWQNRERILKGDKPPLNELIRTFWYMYIKPTLSRAEALTTTTDQYAQLVDQLVYMVKELQLMKYNDISFRDDNELQRTVGANTNVILFSEKAGHQPFLTDIAGKYRISTIALGGQPSVLNIEYFVNELKKTNINLQRSFYLFSIVDFDTSGWIIRDALVNDLAFYGIKNVKVIDLVDPDILTPEEVQTSRYLIPATEAMKAKNKAWLKQVEKRHYKNQKYLIEGNTLYGLEAEAVSTQRLTEKLKEVMVPILGQDEQFLKLFELKELNKAIKNLILYIMT